MIKDLKYFSEAVAFVALGVSIGAAVSSYYVAVEQNVLANKQNEISSVMLSLSQESLLQSRINARKENCIALAAPFLLESWNHAIEGEQDSDLKEYGGKALRVARALQLCQVRYGEDDEGLRRCINTLVDNVEGHKVEDLGDDGIIYTNLIC